MIHISAKKNRNGINVTRRNNPTTFGDIADSVTYNTPLLFGAYTQNNYMTLSAVYAALDLISSSVAELPLNVRQRQENKSTIVENHIITKLFDEMTQSRFVLFKSIVWNVLWFGNAFIYIKRDATGTPIKLIYLDYSDVTINYDKYKDIVTYNVTNHKDIPDTVPQKDMLHFLKNTKDGITGVGILAYALPAFKTADYQNTSASNFFGSGCGISGILKFKNLVPDKSKKEIRESWSSVHGGSSGSGLAVVGGDCDFIPVSQDPSKSQMTESRKFSISEIARFFGISPILLQDLSTGTHNIEEVSIQFVRYTLQPIVSLIESELKRKLLSDTPMWVDLDETYLLTSNKQSMANYLSTLTKSGIISVNEARKMLDLNPVEDGDKLLIPYSDISQNELSGEKVGEIEPEEQPRKKTTRKKSKK